MGQNPLSLCYGVIMQTLTYNQVNIIIVNILHDILNQQCLLLFIFKVQGPLKFPYKTNIDFFLNSAVTVLPKHVRYLHDKIK